MRRLTEDMIIARTKASDLLSVTKLNCWGTDLSDITILRRLQSVEVISLSINSISSLSDVQYCKNLRELYIRRNRIEDLNEVCYLRDLPTLKVLLLLENPCVEKTGTLYRYSVIRCLPTLDTLDMIPVVQEEVEDAMKNGLELYHPILQKNPHHGGNNNSSSSIMESEKNSASSSKCASPNPCTSPTSLHRHFRIAESDETFTEQFVGDQHSFTMGTKTKYNLNSQWSNYFLPFYLIVYSIFSISIELLSQKKDYVSKDCNVQLRRSL